MKRIFKVLMYVVLSLLSVTAFVLTTQYYCNSIGWYDRCFEVISYGLWSLTLLAVFEVFVNKLKPVWAKISAGAATSLLFTVAVYFANNFWRYLHINNEFMWNPPIPYSYLLKADITYTYGYGEYRYLFVFAIMLVLCLITTYLSQPDVKRPIQRFMVDLLYDNDIKEQEYDD